MKFMQELAQQRWDDHRYYHHNRVNQLLHLLSALCFLTSYVLVFSDPVLAVLIGWLLAMVLRQVGHFVFEPKTYDHVNEATHDYKESVKVGYNLRRKVVLLSLWAAAPLVLYLRPAFFGLLDPSAGFLYNMAMLWLAIGVGALLLRTVYLFFSTGVQSGLVWALKILTDPFHDVRIYYKSPYYLLKGDMYDDMSDWYQATMIAGLKREAA